MRDIFPAILALLIGAVGWFYLFYSASAQKLQGIETPAINRKRTRLRRVNGFLMLLFACLFYAGMYAVDSHRLGLPLLIIWSAALVLLMAIIVLALVDLRLTAKLRQRK